MMADWKSPKMIITGGWDGGEIGMGVRWRQWRIVQRSVLWVPVDAHSVAIPRAAGRHLYTRASGSNSKHHLPFLSIRLLNTGNRLSKSKIKCAWGQIPENSEKIMDRYYAMFCSLHVRIVLPFWQMRSEKWLVRVRGSNLTDSVQYGKLSSRYR